MNSVTGESGPVSIDRPRPAISHEVPGRVEQPGLVDTLRIPFLIQESTRTNFNFKKFAPSKPTGGVTGPGRSTRPGTSWLTAGLGRSMLTGPDSPVTEFIPALRTM